MRGTVAAHGLGTGKQDRVAAEWLRALAAETKLVPARTLYRGRGFALARAAAEAIDADFGIMSAGLGYVRAESDVPGYDLTVSPGKPASVATRIEGGFVAAEWWRAIGQGPFAADLRADAGGRGVVMMCLSRAYLSLVVEDLVALEEGAPGTLRLFGLSLGRYLPSRLVGALMPYDERLEAMGAPGTRTDFAARALRDFVDHADLADEAAVHAEMVAARLQGANPPDREARQRVGDEEVRDAIRVFLDAGGAGAGKALAWLRRVRGLSCEQGRFARIYGQVAMEGAV